MNYQCSEEQFLRDVAQHEMRILRDDQHGRHVRFSRTDSGSMRFDLITWTGHLCYTGDMGTFVFSRTKDMFEFFRTDREYNKSRGRELTINPGYWGEKLLSTSRFGGYEEFDADRFKSVINEYRVKWMRDMKERGASKEDRSDLWEAVDFDVLDILYDDNNGMRAQIAAHDFSHRCGNRDYQFTDLWDRSFERYTFHFIWCCYALAWGIQKYDSEKQPSEESTL